MAISDTPQALGLGFPCQKGGEFEMREPFCVMGKKGVQGDFLGVTRNGLVENIYERGDGI